MKIAVSASGLDLEAAIDPRFGRCQYLTILDTDSMEFESMPNQAASAAGGAGIQAAQLVVRKGAKAVLTGRCGPNAYQVFQSNGVEVITGIGGTVSSAVEQYKKGELSPQPQAESQGSRGHRGFSRRAQMGPRRETVDELETQIHEMRGRLEEMTRTLDDLKKAQ